MGQLHLRYETLDELALRGASLSEGELLAVDVDRSEVRVRVDRVLTRRLPPREGALQRAWRHVFPPGEPPAPGEHTFPVSRPPFATDAHTHPVFLRVAGERWLHELELGERVFVVHGAMAGPAVLRVDPAARAAASAAFDRAADLAWASAADDTALHDALFDPHRGDAALDELRWRRTLDLLSLAARGPVTRVPHLVGLADDPETRARLIGQAAETIRRADDRASLAQLVRAMLDRVRFHELLPLLLLADPSRPEDADPVEVARVRLAMILREEPDRAAEFAALAARMRRADGAV